MSKSLLFTAAIAAAVVLSGVKVYADDAGDIYSDNYNTYARVRQRIQPWLRCRSAIPSSRLSCHSPVRIGGKNYTGWAILAQDPTGSMDLFATADTLNGLATDARATLAAPPAGSGRWYKRWRSRIKCITRAGRWLLARTFPVTTTLP